MITAWILYAIVVGALLGAAGLSLEKCLRAHGLPTRWIWAGAMVLSVSWPAGHWIWETRPAEPPPTVSPEITTQVPQEPSLTILPLEPIVVEVPPESIIRLLDGPIVIGWALSTGILLLSGLLLLLRTRYLRARWERGEACGLPVLFSDEWGPAVVGFFKPQIVLPGWSREMDEVSVRFILAHEREHIAAGDLRLTILAGILPVLFPWHLPIWWQLFRLRSAVEGDCDLRVLGGNPGQAKPYVELLLEVGEWTSRARPLAAMLSEPYETLKRRIKIMTTPLPKRPWVRGSLLAAGGVVLVAMACLAPGPIDAQKRRAESDAAGVSAGRAVGSTSAAAGSTEEAAGSREVATVPQEQVVIPRFTPFTVRPAVSNRDEVVAALVREYRSLLADPAPVGTAQVWFFINEEGRVLRTLVNESSGHRTLDDAAIRIADLIEFTPALNRDQPRSVWVSLPIEFTTSQGDEVVGPGAPRTAERVRVVTAPSPDISPASQEVGEIAGTATDAQSGEPIPFVQVFVPGTWRGTLTDQDGRFLVQHVPVGEKQVVAFLIGYGRVEQAVTVTAGERAEASFQLRVSAVPLEPLVVRGTAGTG